MMTPAHISADDTLKLLIVTAPEIALYAGLLALIATGLALGGWRRSTRLWRGRGWSMTLPRRTLRERLGLPG